MKLLYRILSISTLSVLCVSCASTGKKLKPVSSADIDNAVAGTLASDDLAQNISQAIGQVMGDAEKAIVKSVVQQPVGKKKKTAWREQWIFDPEESNEQFIITFRKNKKGFVDFEIQPMPVLEIE